MRKGWVILFGGGLLVWWAFLLGRRLFAAEPLLERPVTLPADAGTVARPDAETTVPVGPPGAWAVSPRVSLSTGETFDTVQGAIKAARPGQSILIPTGVYRITGLVIWHKQDLQLVAQGGPAYFINESLGQGHANTALHITESRGIRLRGLWFDNGQVKDGGGTAVLLGDVADVRLEQVHIAQASGNAIMASYTNGLTLEDVVCERSARNDLVVVWSRGPVEIRRSRFLSPYGPVVFERPASNTVNRSFVMSPRPSSFTVEQSLFATGLSLNLEGTPLSLSQSVVLSRASSALRELEPFVAAGTWLGGTLEGALSSQQETALARGQSLLLQTPARGPLRAMPSIPGVEAVGPSDTQRAEALRALGLSP
jgi:hypothetical protein